MRSVRTIVVVILAMLAPLGTVARAGAAPEVTDAAAAARPVVIPQSVTPQSGSITVFPDGQPLAAFVVAAAPKPPIAVRFDLFDTASGARETYRVSTLTAGWVKTAPVRLSPGVPYAIRVTATDAAGRSGSYDQRTAGGFSATKLSAVGQPAQLGDQTCGLLSGRAAVRSVTCGTTGTVSVGSAPVLTACADPTTTAGFRAPRCLPDPRPARYLVVFRSDVSDVAGEADRLERLAGVDLDAVRSGRAWVDASAASAVLLFKDPAVASVLRAGTDALDYWAESTADGCVTRSVGALRITALAGTSAEMTRAFRSVGDGCGLVLRSSSSTAVQDINIPHPPDAPNGCPAKHLGYFSGSHTMQDGLTTDLSWLRSRHVYETDGNCHAYWHREANYVRTGDGPCWWRARWPKSTHVDWVKTGTVARAEYDGQLQSREDPPWNSNCTPGALPVRPLGIDCDVKVSAIVSNTPWNISWVTISDVKEATTDNSGACRLLHSSTASAGSYANWGGDSSDCVIQLRPSGGDNRLSGASSRC